MPPLLYAADMHTQLCFLLNRLEDLTTALCLTLTQVAQIIRPTLPAPLQLPSNSNDPAILIDI